MIYVSQGHEKGIGLELYLKSITSISKTKDFNLICDRKTLEENLNLLGLNYKLNKSELIISNRKYNITFVDQINNPTIDSLNYILSVITKEDILITLPSSKDQFYLDGKIFSGHTEFFRKKFNINELPMSFYTDDLSITLLSDHLPLSKVTSSLRSDDIVKKVSMAIDKLIEYKEIDGVVFSGVNPHAGESGQLGDEENFIVESIKSLQNKYENLYFKGPIPADTIHFNFKKSEHYIFAYHDQGLGIFKMKSGLNGINITFGMPFLRLSPDHGTAFDIFGEGSANSQGMTYLLEKAKLWHKKTHP